MVCYLVFIVSLIFIGVLAIGFIYMPHTLIRTYPEGESIYNAFLYNFIDLDENNIYKLI